MGAHDGMNRCWEAAALVLVPQTLLSSIGAPTCDIGGRVLSSRSVMTRDLLGERGRLSSILSFDSRGRGSLTEPMALDWVVTS